MSDRHYAVFIAVFCGCAALECPPKGHPDAYLASFADELRYRWALFHGEFEGTTAYLRNFITDGYLSAPRDEAVTTANLVGEPASKGELSKLNIRLITKNFCPG